LAAVLQILKDDLNSDKNTALKTVTGPHKITTISNSWKAIQFTVPASSTRSLSRFAIKTKIAPVVCLNKIVLKDNLNTGVWPQDEEGGPDQAKGEDHSCSDAHQLAHLQKTISHFLPMSIRVTSAV
jgi:hypothetical protein